MRKKLGNKTLLDRAAILSATDAVYETVSVPEWGGDVRVRAISAAARDDLEQAVFSAAQTKQPLRNFRARLAALCLVDDLGAPLFTPDDVEVLGNKSAAAMERVYRVAVRLNAMSAQDVEALEKN